MFAEVTFKTPIDIYSKFSISANLFISTSDSFTMAFHLFGSLGITDGMTWE